METHRYVYQITVYGWNAGVGNPQQVIGSVFGVTEPLTSDQVVVWLRETTAEECSKLTKKGFVSPIPTIVTFNKVT